MHTCNLILEYALGVRNRRKNKQETDLFVHGNAIMKKIQSVLQTMMNKQKQVTVPSIFERMQGEVWR